MKVLTADEEVAGVEYGTFTKSGANGNGTGTENGSYHPGDSESSQGSSSAEQTPFGSLRSLVCRLYPSLDICQEGRFDCSENPCHPSLQAFVVFRHDFWGSALMVVGLALICIGLYLLHNTPPQLSSFLLLGHFIGLIGLLVYVGLRNACFCWRFERLSIHSVVHDLTAYASYLLILVGLILVFSSSLHQHLQWDLTVLKFGLVSESLGLLLYFVVLRPVRAHESELARNACKRWRVYRRADSSDIWETGEGDEGTKNTGGVAAAAAGGAGTRSNELI